MMTQRTSCERVSRVAATSCALLLMTAVDVDAQTFAQSDLHEAARRLGTLSSQMNEMMDPMLTREGRYFGFVFDVRYNRVSDFATTIDGEASKAQLDRAFAGLASLVNLGAVDRYVGVYLGGYAYGVSRPLSIIAPDLDGQPQRSGSEAAGEQFIDDVYGVLGRVGDFTGRFGYARSRTLTSDPLVLSEEFQQSSSANALDFAAGWRGIELRARMDLDPVGIQVGWLSAEVTQFALPWLGVEVTPRQQLVLPRVWLTFGLEDYGAQILDVGKRGKDALVGWRYEQPLLGLLPDNMILPPKGLSALGFETHGSFTLTRGTLRDATVQGTIGLWLKYLRLEFSGGVSHFSDPGLEALLGQSSVRGTSISGRLGLGMDTRDYIAPDKDHDWIFEIFATANFRKSWADDLVTVVDIAGHPVVVFEIAMATQF